MNGLFFSLSRHRLNSTIRVLCPLIEDRIKSQAENTWREYDLRKELVRCILGSQVRNEMAIALTENLDQAGMLDDAWWTRCRNHGFGTIVFDVLSDRKEDLPHRGRYRFPRARTNQLTRARDALARVPLSARLVINDNPRCLRKNLVADIPGLGPKQASMFLRNIGKSYDLAILDTHVIRFMDIQNLLPMGQVHIGTVSGYEKVEQVIVKYATTLGYPVGYLDWAIWATMKAARELGL